MSARNADSMTNVQGEFHARQPRAEPETPSAHKPGVKVGNDAAPEFHAKTLPPGSAPASNTFKPNPTSETPSQANNDLTERSHGKESTKTTASDTLGGATSADVHKGLGHPGQGQTSRELRHDGGGKHGMGSGGSGLVGAGASGAPSGNMQVDEKVQPDQRALEKEEGGYAGTRGKPGDGHGADELPNETA